MAHASGQAASTSWAVELREERRQSEEGWKQAAGAETSMCGHLGAWQARAADQQGAVAHVGCMTGGKLTRHKVGPRECGRCG